MVAFEKPVLLARSSPHYMNGVVARRNNFNEPIFRGSSICYK